MCVPVDDDPGPAAAEELGHVQTIENKAARYHVTSQLDTSQQLDSPPQNCPENTPLIFSTHHNVLWPETKAENNDLHFLHFFLTYSHQQEQLSSQT